MADLRLFQIQKNKAVAKPNRSFKSEKEIQNFFEQNLETLLGIRFIKTEYVIDGEYSGRIDSLGLDENNCPVIIEYKKEKGQNILSQVLFYFNWLVSHKGDFEMLCLKKFGKVIDIDWSSPRAICIARDFAKYDDYAINQIPINIELMKYRLFDDNLLVLEMASKTSKQKTINSNSSIANSTNSISEKNSRTRPTMQEMVDKASPKILEILENIDDFCDELGNDIQKRVLKFYTSYATIQNFLCIIITPSKNVVKLIIKPHLRTIENPPAFARDVSNTGHLGTGDTELTIKNLEDLEKAKPLIELSYLA